MGASSLCCFCIVKAEEYSPCTENDGVSELEIVGAEGASTSERTEYIAKAEESPSTVVDAVAELEAMTMVGTEGASTSGRSEYYSARCEAMMRSRGQFSDDIALEIEFSKSHWSEVSRAEVAPQSAEEEELNRENRELLMQLRQEYPFLFWHSLDGYVLGRMIAKGGQAEIYEVAGRPHRLMKVFERGTSLRDLQRSWPRPVLQHNVRHCIMCANMLQDGRFAFLMVRCWGDLRKLIDQVMQEKNVDGIQGPPFPYKWKEYSRWTFHPLGFMLGIAKHMRDLHKKRVSHRDLKASNILLHNDYKSGYHVTADTSIMIADFECSIGVLGTGFWRAPEILSTLGEQEAITNEQWKKADVYSYGMTCFEIVTGRIPFDGELGNTRVDRQLVIDGRRPQLPSDLDDAVKDLITKCWAPNPRLRPTFSRIVDMVGPILTRECEFRLFGIGDELPPQYRLATIQEVNDYPFTSRKAMGRWKIAKLANGFVDGSSCQMETSFSKQRYVRHKLAIPLHINTLA